MWLLTFVWRPSIRDASYLDYFPILVSDATANEGPQLTQEATIFNVKAVYGCVTTAESILKSFGIASEICDQAE